jgi:hypothetical protein
MRQHTSAYVRGHDVANAGGGYEMLAYADVCMRMLAYADVCMRTYAGGGSESAAPVPQRKAMKAHTGCLS